MAHITGGGITENLPRIIPKGMGAVVDLASWQSPPLFEHLQQLGNVEQDEMLRTFNMGIGLIVVVPAEKVKKAKAVLNRANERHYIIGRISPRRTQSHLQLAQRQVRLRSSLNDHPQTLENPPLPPPRHSNGHKAGPLLIRTGDCCKPISDPH